MHLKLGQLWLCQTFFSCCCLFVVVCRLSSGVNIFVPRLILNCNMFYKTVKCIRIEFLKSRKKFASWVLVPLKMSNMVFCLFFWCPRPTANCRRGYTCTKLFYYWNSVTLGFGGHICKIIHFKDPYRALQTLTPKVLYLFLTSITNKSDI